MIRFEIIDGLLFVPGRVRQGEKQAEIRFIIDTGASGSAVDVNFFRPDFARHARFAEISGAGGSTSVLLQEVDVIQLGHLLLNNVKLQFGDLENAFGVQGILGNDILVAHNALIDYRTSQLSLI